MNNRELLEVLREELSKHTHFDLVIYTGIDRDLNRSYKFDRICGFDRDRDNDMLRIVIMIIDGSLIIRTKLFESFSFDDAMKIPLCDPEMFNHVIAVIKNLENAENNSKRIDDQCDE